MIKYENECVDCPRELGCLGKTCPYLNVPHYYCDRCNNENKLYFYKNEQLCADCILSLFYIVEE